MKVAIPLKELNDELEENHVETEKQLLAEIGKRWIPLLAYGLRGRKRKGGGGRRNEGFLYLFCHELRRPKGYVASRAAGAFEICRRDYENTIAPFRDLVANLQR
jgi:hypothetical protein